MAGNLLEGLLTVPPQSKPTAGSFDTRPKQMEAWVAALPMANTGECARRIYTALREMNRLVIAPQDRFKALETLRAPHFHVTEALKKHYINQNLPLSPKNQKIAELAIHLNSEMAIGYKAVIAGKLAKTFSRLNQKGLGTSLHRAIRYLSNVMLCSYQVYIDPPENTWLELHHLYLYAEENHLHSTIVKDQVVTDALLDSCVADIYKQILLLALSGPYRLRQPITDAVYLALKDWAPHCRILPYETDTGAKNSFSVNLNSDAAPGYFTDNGNANPLFCRNVDTTEMTRLISESNLPRGVQAKGIPEDVIKRLALAWSGKSHRLFSRSTRSNEITITLGLSATHHFIDEILRPLLDTSGPVCAGTIDTFTMLSANPDPNDSMQLDLSAQYTSTPVFGISNIDDHTPDVWDPDYTYRVNNPSYRLQADAEEDQRRKTALFAPVDCRGINESAGGYCLLGQLSYDKDSRRVQVGELVGLRDETDASSLQFSIGVIRRIKSWNNGLELGIQKLAPCAEAIATAAIGKDGKVSRYQRSLVLPKLAGINQPATLITHAWHREGDQLIASIHGQKIHLILTKALEITGVFAQFEFSIQETDEKQRPVQTENSNDEFESVWSIL